MSYDVYLLEPETGDEIKLNFNHDMSGGTVASGGTSQAWLNVTYNYAPIFARVFPSDGLRWLEEKTAADTIEQLRQAISELRDDDEPYSYWEPTEGNAKQALKYLLNFALLRPDGIWEVR